MSVEIYFDGATEPFNPGGIASYGFVILRDGKTVLEGKGTVGTPGTPESTNNVAEYTALIKGLEGALGVVQAGEGIEVRGDSQLVIRQLEGLYAVNAPHLKPLHGKGTAAIAGLVAKGFPVKLSWVPREENGHADRLSKEAVVDALKANPGILDDAVLGFGKHKGKKWKDVPQGYRGWLFEKK
jgi:ribonuclease HI